LDQELQISDFDYELPEELIAQEPSRTRDQARLLVVHRQLQTFSDRTIRDLPGLLSPGDLLVFNNTKVIPARLYGKRASTEGKWEGLYLHTPPQSPPSQGGEVWEILSHTRGYLRAGEFVDLFDREHKPSQYRLKVVGRTPDKHLLVQPDPPIAPLVLLEEIGHVPIPCYIRRGVDRDDDRQRYQTVYAKYEGSVAAPTAGLHFTPDLLQQLTDRDVEFAFVTLHVGFGTFQPIKTAQLSEHRMHSEWCALPAETVLAIEKCRAAGKKVIAVGTTTVRTLESVYLKNNGHLQTWSGSTDLFIQPPFFFHTIDGLLTNFHLPQSSLLILVCAFAGRELTLRAYAHAVQERYRFYSYGDAMLIQ
jgi:S-adenosylmethionine:tRNA ribosyltransferase-isomerase